MCSETTVYVLLSLACFLQGDRFINCGFLWQPGHSKQFKYNKARPYHNCYSVSGVCLLSLFMDYEINLLIVDFDIKVAVHSKRLAGPRPCLARPWLCH